MHTPLCHHATGEPTQYAARALEIGLSEIGFSEHSPMPRDDFDDWRMLLSDLDEYVEKIRRARAEHQAEPEAPGEAAVQSHASHYRMALVLSAVVTVILLFTGWWGGELAYKHKIGAVDGEPTGRAHPLDPQGERVAERDERRGELEVPPVDAGKHEGRDVTAGQHLFAAGVPAARKAPWSRCVVTPRLAP